MKRITFFSPLLLLFLLRSPRPIMQYVIPLHYVQPNPLIPSEQRLNVNSLNLTSTSKNPLASSSSWLLTLLPFTTSVAKKHPPLTSLPSFVFLRAVLSSWQRNESNLLVHYQPQINRCGPRSLLNCSFSLIFVICKYDRLSKLEIRSSQKADLSDSCVNQS